MKELKIKIKNEEHYQQVQKCLIALGCVIPRALDMFNTVKFDFIFCSYDGSIKIGSENATWTNNSLAETTLLGLQGMVRNKKKRENNEMVNSVSENDWEKMLKEQNKKNKLSREFSGYVSEWNYNLHLEEKISSLPFDIKKPNDKTKYFKARLIVEGEIVKEKDVEKFTQNIMEQGDMSKTKKKEFKEGDRVFDTDVGWCEIENVNKSNVYLYETKRTCFNGYGQTDSASLRQLFHSPQEASEYFDKIKEPISKEKEMLVILYDVQANHSGRLSERHTTELEKLIEYFESAVDKTAQKN